LAEQDQIIKAGAIGWAAHGFLGRRWGVSDAAANAVLPGSEMITAEQVHSSDAIIVERAWNFANRPRADALVTNRPGLLLAIVTADCAPVLLADQTAGVVGAAHAGWRGAHGGVIAATVQAMEELGAKPARIAAAIGPCIAQESYEVDGRFRAQFGPGAAQFFTPGKIAHHQFDLEAYVAFRLEQSGVGVIERLGLDTYTDDTRFYSYRRATHRGQAADGRQLSLIGLTR